MRALPRLLLPALGLMVAGCDLAPQDPPPAPPPAAFFKEDGDWRPWWTVFGDDRLDQLECRLDGENQDLRQALARHDQATALAREAGAAQYPQLSYSGGANRNQLSRSVAILSHPNLYNNDLAEGSLSWEIDLWGRVRNLVAAASLRASASAADLAATKLALESDLATAYLGLQALDAQQQTVDRAVTAYQDALAFTQRRHDGGAAAQIDVDQAQLQRDNALTQATENRLRRAQLEHVIAVLVGEAPANFNLPPQPLVALPPPIATVLPSTLLERRPDIAAAERLVAATNADIGVARAAFFPTFDLAAVGGVQSALPHRLFDAASRLWAIGPSLSGPLYDGGQRSAATDQARAIRDEAVAAYRQTVLAAYREVEDNLVALHRLESEAASQSSALASAQRALSQAETRYKGGLATYLEVTTAQNAALAAESSAIDIRNRRMAAAVGLIQALGGGWQGFSQTAMP